MAYRKFKSLNLYRCCDIYLFILIVCFNSLQVQCNHREKGIIVSKNSAFFPKKGGLNIARNISQKLENEPFHFPIDRRLSSRKRRKQSRSDSEGASAEDSRDDGYSSYEVNFGEEQQDPVNNLDSNLFNSEDGGEDDDSSSNKNGLNYADTSNYTNSSIVEPEVVSSGSENNDVERLVRNQVDFAGTNWATLPPSNAHQTQSDEDSYNNFHDLDLNYHANKIEDNTNNPVYNQKVVSYEEPKNRIYPNHNYNFSYESFKPATTTTASPRGIILNFDFESTIDPMTTSSDRSYKYGLYDRPYSMPTHQPTFDGGVGDRPSQSIEYMYRLRGPITDNRYHQPSIAKPNSSNIFNNNTSKSKGGESVMLNENGGISPYGYIDISTSNGQQIISSPHDRDQTNGNESKNFINSRSHTSNQLSNPYKIGETRLMNGYAGTTMAPTTTTTTTTLQSNFNGNLAARLNANRNKNRKQKGDQSSGGQIYNTSVEPLIINFQTTKHTSPKPHLETVTSMATSTTLQHFQPQHKRTRIPLPMKSTTIKQPLTTLATTPITTPTTLAPNLAPALLKASMSNRSKSGGVLPATNRHSVKSSANHHHHLHSHVHSIKPAVISIPIPIQPKFAPYDSLLATAAAAAAAAAATASANQRKPFLTQSLGIQPHPPRIPHPKFTSLTSPRVNTIPIGGKLEHNTRINKYKLRKESMGQPSNGESETQFVSSYQNPSIISNLLDSANRAIKQVVTGNTGSLLNLQTSNNNQVTSAIVDPLSKKYTNNREATSALASDTDEATYYHPSQELAPSSLIETGFSPFESFALYQRPIDESSNHFVHDYLESLLNGLPEKQNAPLFYVQKPPLETSISSMNSEQKPQVVSHSYNNIDWDVINNQNVTLPGISSIESGLFRPNGQQDSNLVYSSLANNSPETLMHSDRVSSQLNTNNNHQISGPQPISGSLGEQPNFISAFDSPYWDNSRGKMMVNDGSQTSGRLVKNINNHYNPNNTKSRDQYNDLNHGRSPDKQNNMKSHSNSSNSMQYALSHYIDDGNHQENNLNKNNNKNLYYDLFDNVDKQANKYSVPYGIDFYTADGASDIFRPITPLNYNFKTTSSNLSNKYSQHPSMITSNQQSVVYGFDHHLPANKSAKKKSVHQSTKSNQSIRDQIMEGHKSEVNSFYRPTNVHSSNNIYAKHAHPFSQSQPLHLLPLLPPHHLYPSDAVHHALAGSGLRPHIMAANSLVNYHRQQLIDHHFMHHHYPYQDQDLKTSESARLAVAAPLKGSFLAHFWPLALALLPVMIIVAIVSQMVMAAPLILFAMATLTMSRIMGPGLQNRNDLEMLDPDPKASMDSLVSKMPSQSFLTSLLLPASASGPETTTTSSKSERKDNLNSVENDGLNNSTKRRKKRRRKRESGYFNLSKSVTILDEYFDNIKMKF